MGENPADYSFNSTNKTKKVKFMIIVPVKEGENIERALKRFKRKSEKTGVIKEVRTRKQYEKPSVVKRVKMQHAIYVNKLHSAEE
jgi:small subunit ribosomal protein S21